jgi:pimeloyl-ACP methyl ester carboxylesterase
MRRLVSLALIVLALGAAADEVRAQALQLFNDGDGTLGGRTDWSDVVIFHDWRVQQHSVMGHYRLLDPQDRRVARGTLFDCLSRLYLIRDERKLAALPKEVVIVMHGLGGYRHRMQGMVDHLRDSGFTVLNFGYASTRGDMGASARSLAEVVHFLTGVETVSFVTHSMGAVVVRRYLHDVAQRAPERRPQVVYKRFVMITPPNHGAEILDTIPNEGLMRLVAEQRGGAYAELSPVRGWPELAPTLATPDFEFGIIAGGTGNDRGYLAEVPGDDDGLLSVATMQLAGAADYLQTGGVHQLMPDYVEVRAATVNFLRYGYFRSAAERTPL